MASKEKLRNTLPLDRPMAFMRPISRVRSWTDINRVLMMPMEAARRAMPPNMENTTRMMSKKVFIMPIWSSTVMPVSLSFSRAALMSSTFTEGSNSAVANMTRLA